MNVNKDLMDITILNEGFELSQHPFKIYLL